MEDTRASLDIRSVVKMFDIDCAAEKLKQAEQGLREAKQQLSAEVAKLRGQCGLVDGQEIARELYWNYPSVPISAIAEMLGIRIYLLTSWVGPLVTEFTCDRCGEYLIATSRSNLKELQARIKRDRIQWAEGYREVCGDCQKDILRERERRESP